MNPLLKFRNIQEAERAALRGLQIGVGAVLLGFILTLTSGSVGMTVMILGGLVILGEVILFGLASKRTSIARKCTRCGKANPVFEEEKHFKCINCGYVTILRDA